MKINKNFKVLNKVKVYSPLITYNFIINYSQIM